MSTRVGLGEHVNVLDWTTSVAVQGVPPSFTVHVVTPALVTEVTEVQAPLYIDVTVETPHINEFPKSTPLNLVVQQFSLTVIVN